jgi:hypothetical protein
MPERPEHLARLTSRPTEMEAGIVVATLNENGIRAIATGAATAGFRAEAPGWVQILVAEEDLPRAEELLAGIDQHQDDVDWSQVDVGEPERDEVPDSVPWWTRRGFWLPVTQVLIVLILIWVALGFMGDVVELITRSLHAIFSWGSGQ